jgi:hypothetical protein
LKVAIAAAFVGTIVAETVAANKGIGNLMLVASSCFEVPLAFAALLVTSVMGIGMYLICAAVERRMTGWAMRGADADPPGRGERRLNPPQAEALGASIGAIGGFSSADVAAVIRRPGRRSSERNLGRQRWRGEAREHPTHGDRGLLTMISQFFSVVSAQKIQSKPSAPNKLIMRLLHAFADTLSVNPH